MSEEKEKEKKVRFSVTMSESVVTEIDEQRANIPRSTYIEYKLREAIMPKKEEKKEQS